MQAYHMLLPFLLTVRRGKEQQEGLHERILWRTFRQRASKAVMVELSGSQGQGQPLHPFLKLVLLNRNPTQRVLFRPWWLQKRIRIHSV